MVYGNVSFAIIEDRKFKWGPNSPEAKTHPEDAVLLGDRQLNFIKDWTADWEGALLKTILSATVFAQAHTHMAAEKKTRQDKDANGWPPNGRNRALREIRKGFAFLYAGDNHLPTIVQHGIDEWRDAGFSFTVPSVAAGYPRAWMPEEPGANREPDSPEYTGDHFDRHGNKITMWAAANPVIWAPKIGNLDVMDKKSSGFGLVRFHTGKQTYTIECWRLLGDLDTPQTGQFKGWPRTISIFDNYGRKPVGWLPLITAREFADPVFQVINEKNKEVVYTLRVKGKSFSPMVFEKGSYTVKVMHPETGQKQILKGQKITKENK